ncbi:MAG: alanine--tRNA ligase [Candidatus Woesearchaeota archaeon]
MNYKNISNIYLDYFVKEKHRVLKSASLIPEEDDPSSLFINSGMQPLKKYFLGLERPPSRRLCSVQKCFRTGDIDKVGDNARSLTFFFMMGNWSIGDYWKLGTIELAWDLIVNKYKFDKNKIWVSVFKGDKSVPKDNESIKIWKNIGIPKNRIVELGVDDNFWSAGPTGPCGTCTEMYYDTGKGCEKKSCKPGCDCDRFIEFWNLVFIEFDRDSEGKLKKLDFSSVDTGAGLERFAMLLQKKNSVYETDLFEPVLNKLEKLCKKKFGKDKEVDKAMRIILDHGRAIVFIIGDGVVPEKVDKGYVLRRVIRRMIRYGNKLGLAKEQVLSLCGLFIDMYKDEFPKLKKKDYILKIIDEEYAKFLKGLNRGTRLLEQVMKELKTKTIPGGDVFKLYDTYGFPIELTEEMAEEKGFKIDRKGYENAFSKHRKVSSVSATKRFKGGLGESTEEAKKYHTATHLLLKALQDVLSKDIEQRGSNITSERMRFDFNFDRAMTNEEIKKVEDLVNKKIKESLLIKKEEMNYDLAKKKGYSGIFEAKYGKKVICYSIGNYSKEICGGPHANNTKELGHFKIVKEQSIAAGIRRIKAVLE